MKHVQYRYLISTPANYDTKDKWPLILFLHGYDERGDDPQVLKSYGVPKIAARRRTFPFVTASPQCPSTSTWISETDALMSYLDMIVGSFRVDETRIYLTGLSMGGYATWELAAEFPDRFAAVAPVCGGGSWLTGFPDKVLAMKDVPVWAFHGELDDEVPVAESEMLISRLQELGAREARLTIFPGVGHDSWNNAYDSTELYKWLLAHKK